MLEFATNSEKEMPIARIKVIGVGGGGGNTINSMINANLLGIEFIVANTDAQALALSKAEHIVQLGIKSTKGLGTGANPELGKRAAEEDLSLLMEYLEDANIVFLTGGLGGGTGSGALPVIARALKEKNILSIAVVTKPFDFEGKKRALIAQTAVQELKKEVDTLLIIPNQKLLEVVDQTVSMIDAFAMIDNILNQSVKGIADIISIPGKINVDFADLRTIMKDMGLAVMGTGKASGSERALNAALQAIASPLLENMSIKGAKGVLVNISGGPNLGLHEIRIAANVITEQADPHANIIVGSVIDQHIGDEIIVTVIATGFEQYESEKEVQEPRLREHETIRSYQPAREQSIPLGEQKKAPSHEVTSTLLQESSMPTVHATTSSQELLLLQEKNVTAAFEIPHDTELDVPTFMRQHEQP